MKNVLLPTDFSQNSINAIEYAADLLNATDCNFYILNVQKASSFISDDFRTMKPSATVYQSLIASAKASINEIIIKMEAKANDRHKYIAMVDYDNFIDAIKQACVAKEIDLIIMGTQGATGADKVIFGSNTVRTMQRSLKPVLAVPEGCKFKGLERIAFASDFRLQYDEKDILPVTKLVELHNSRIEVVHMLTGDKLSPDQEENKSDLDEMLMAFNHEFVDLEKKDLYQAVMLYIEKNAIELLVMMSKRHSFLERLFTKKNLKTFGLKINIPMLVIQNSRELII